MVPSEDFELRLVRAYEWGRIRHALVKSAPLIACACVAALLAQKPWLVSVPAVLLWSLASVFFWRGQTLGYGARVGMMAGLVPLVASLSMRAWPHTCTSAGCVSQWCVPVCAAGGVIAATIVARRARGVAAPHVYWLSAGIVCTLTGALACGCVGYYGTTALLVAFVLTSVPAGYALARAPKA